jgi:hypothetical protein
VLNELKYALRMLVKTRRFTAIAVLVPAVGIGANSAILFSASRRNQPSECN